MSAIVVASALAAGGVASVGSYYGIRALTGPVTLQREPVKYTETYQQLLARFARRDGVVERPREYVLARSQPSGTRQVPILPLSRTPTGLPLPLPPERYPSNRKDWIRQSLANLRTAMSAAGRGDEDVRCAFCLTVIETGWGKIGWNWNMGNVKGSSAYHGNAETIANGFLWTRTPESIGAYVLVDRVNSLDCYHAFENWTAYCRYQARLLTEYPNFRGVREAWRVGGIEGLYAGERIFAKGGYSGTGEMGRLADARAYWSRMRRLFQTEWESRGVWNG